MHLSRVGEKLCWFYLISKEIQGIDGNNIKNTVKSILVKSDLFKEHTLQRLSFSMMYSIFSLKLYLTLQPKLFWDSVITSKKQMSMD